MNRDDLMEKLQLRAGVILATKSEATENISSVRFPPPCFSSSKEYSDWLSQAEVAPPPKRKDFPAEPNYCRDCNPEGQAEFIAQGRCLFPMVRFQTTKNIDGDDEVVGFTPRRFLPRTGHGSYGHAVWRVDDTGNKNRGIYMTRWNVMSNGSEQRKVVDWAGAQRFMEKWGVALGEEPAEDA